MSTDQTTEAFAPAGQTTDERLQRLDERVSALERSLPLVIAGGPDDRTNDWTQQQIDQLAEEVERLTNRCQELELQRADARQRVQELERINAQQEHLGEAVAMVKEERDRLQRETRKLRSQVQELSGRLAGARDGRERAERLLAEAREEIALLQQQQTTAECI